MSCCQNCDRDQASAPEATEPEASDAADPKTIRALSPIVPPLGSALDSAYERIGVEGRPGSRVVMPLDATTRCRMEQGKCKLVVDEWTGFRVWKCSHRCVGTCSLKYGPFARCNMINVGGAKYACSCDRKTRLEGCSATVTKFGGSSVAKCEKTDDCRHAHGWKTDCRTGNPKTMPTKWQRICGCGYWRH